MIALDEHVGAAVHKTNSAPREAEQGAGKRIAYTGDCVGTDGGAPRVLARRVMVYLCLSLQRFVVPLCCGGPAEPYRPTAPAV
ncbi:unnamed protein product [Boreogadus saida]